MESALYGIYALVFVSEILLVHCAHSFDFWHVNNSCINTVCQHFPWSILYMVNWTCDFSQSESRNYFEWIIINIKRLTSASIKYNYSKLIHHAVTTCHHYFSCYQNYSLRHGMAHNNTNNAPFSLTFAFTDTCNLWQTLQDAGYYVSRLGDVWSRVWRDSCLPK